ncbi:MAG: Iron-sulfur cluster assembly accessory protein [uncultured Thiotrichaceae bacterium]|uniref:Iron-sulfur cluster assembly accessory protein n=1 Tax=uncultured Thiotrichaceae bacterium TaxID=298394 RepID=A0A6S6SVA5_9GAMM|nr:MAG: Iron-sulfur cluster assembly accessory protein [uncultured Thiotrichaceae bacterium]
MITVTPEAAAQIKVSAQQGNTGDMPLRISIERKEDSKFHYQMGFDDQLRPGDQRVESEGITMVVDGISLPLANGLMLDFVELDGTMEFVFMNPNDPNYTPPQEQ